MPMGPVAARTLAVAGRIVRGLVEEHRLWVAVLAGPGEAVAADASC